MLRQIKNLSKLQLCNLFGLNVLRHTKDKKTKFKSVALGLVWALLILMIASYVGGYAYVFMLMDMSDILPAFLIAISSMIIFFFGIFKAGSVIFQKNSYDILCSLPVSQTAIVVSRFICMYVENLLLTLVIMLPGLTVYACFVQPAITFYAIAILEILAIPLLPITAATFIGALINGISSRMKHKNLVGAFLTLVVALALMLGSSKLTTIDGEFSLEMLENLSNIIIDLLGNIYPIAITMGSAMVNGDFVTCLACIGVFLVIFVVMAAIVSMSFHSICRRLFATSAKHNYRMKQLKTSSILGTLYKKELKRYFSSGVYISNTIIGPIMAVVLSATVFVMGIDTIKAQPLPFDIVELIPFALSAVFSLMTTTSCSISMEGKEWWIVKSLPLKTKTILNSKILLNLSVFAPFYIVSEILLILAVKPAPLDMLWMLAIPAIMIVFACVFGITANLAFPVFNWENETAVVKQGLSVLLSMLGAILVLISAVPVVLITNVSSYLIKLVICIVFMMITALLHKKNNSVDLQKLG